jgi:hypothetical protein
MQHSPLQDSRRPRKSPKCSQSPRCHRNVVSPLSPLTCRGADAAAVSAATSNLNSASAGIKTIAAGLLTGKAAPASARDQVGAGLKGALSSLSNVTSLYCSFCCGLMEGIRLLLRHRLIML